MVFISNSHKKLQKKKSMGLKKEIPLWAFICRHLLLGKMRYLDTLVSIHLPCSFRPRGKAAAHREPQACLAALKRSATLTEGCDSFGEALGEHAALATALKWHRVQRAPSSSKFILNRARKGERSRPSRAGHDEQILGKRPGETTSPITGTLLTKQVNLQLLVVSNCNFFLFCAILPKRIKS